MTEKNKNKFEVYIQNKIKKQKQFEDQKIIDEIIESFKKKHEKEHQEKIAKAKETLKILTERV